MRDESETPEAPAAPQRKLTPANENPWYVLMTLYGEQEGPFTDPNLHNLNRKAWNAWAGQAMNAETLAVAASSSKIDLNELDEWKNCGTIIRIRFGEEYEKRNPSVEVVPELPDPKHKVHCGYTVFPLSLNLSGFVIPSEIDLCHARLERLAGFELTTFLGESWFSHAEFKGAAVFRNASFKERAVFYSTRYWGRCDFSKSKFEYETQLSFSTFGKGVSFQGATFEGVASFERCHFGELDRLRTGAYFYGCRFLKPATFRSSMFVGAFPEFGGAELHENTSFTARFDPTEPELRLFPDQKGAVFWPKESEQDPETARDSCATIRHIVAKQGLPEDEHFFFRREMHFAGKIGPIWQRLPYLLFGLFSEYGYSILRPTLWLLGVWALGFAAFWGYFSGCCVPAPDSVIERPMGSAMALSFSNLFPLFGFGRVYFGQQFMEKLPAVLQFFSGFQTVASLPLLFFLGLGLRQRFRLR